MGGNDMQEMGYDELNEGLGLTQSTIAALFEVSVYVCVPL
jgi:hypothetical protein